VRELDNVIQRALIVHNDNLISDEDIMLENSPLSLSRPEPVAVSIDPELSVFKSGVYEQEHRIILETMRACANRRKEVAEKLGISARTLRYKLARMRESGIALPF
jgi:two-component system response regulator FlrC